MRGGVDEKLGERQPGADTAYEYLEYGLEIAES